MAWPAKNLEKPKENLGFRPNRPTTEPTTHRPSHNMPPPAPNHLLFSFEGVVPSSSEQLCSPKPTTNHKERAANQPKQPPTTNQPTNQTPTTNQPTTDNQPTNNRPTTDNQPTTNPPIPRIPKAKSQEPKLRWPGGMCGALEYGAPPAGVGRVECSKCNSGHSVIPYTGLAHPTGTAPTSARKTGHIGSQPGQAGSQPA